LNPLVYKIMGHAIRYTRKTKIKDIRELRERIVDDGISWISASSMKLLDSGERDVELVWLQKKDSPRDSPPLTFQR